MLYDEMRIGQCEIAPNDWYWKRCPEREKIEMKKDAQMGKECDEKDEKWFT